MNNQQQWGTSNRGGGGSGGGRGGFRGRGGGRNNNRGGGGGRFNNNNFNNPQGRGGGGGRQGGGGGVGVGRDPASFGILRICRNFATTGQCSHGNQCSWLHVVQRHAEVLAAPKPPFNNNNNTNTFNNNNNMPNFSTVSAITIWEQQQQGTFKIFTASHDGYWRLWNTANAQFTMEFEQNLYGTIRKCEIYNHYLIAAFAGPIPTLPGTASAGQTHVWNLQAPQQPPTELQITRHPDANRSIPYAHNMAVTAIHMSGEVLVTGSQDGSIRIWNLAQVLVQTTLPGHAGQVTGLALVSGNSLLWSCGMDQCIRIWNCTDSSLQHCMSLPTPVTDLIPYQDSQFILTSGMDGSINVWKADSGECLSAATSSEGIICMCIAKDGANNELLLTGMEHGAIQCRNLTPIGAKVPALTLLFTLSRSHEGAVYAVTAGPSATFYSGGADGKMLVCSFVGDVLASIK